MKKPHVKISRKVTINDPFRGRSMKASHTVSRSGYARGGGVQGYGDTKDSYLRGAGSPWSMAHKKQK